VRLVPIDFEKSAADWLWQRTPGVCSKIGLKKSLCFRGQNRGFWACFGGKIEKFGGYFGTFCKEMTVESRPPCFGLKEVIL
jgi:hypothetical protein